MAVRALSLAIRTYLLGALAALVIRFLYASVRWSVIAQPAFEPNPKETGPILIAFWHGRMLMIPRFYMGARGGKRRAKGYVLISRHGDGRLIAFAVRLLGIRSVAGSSSRGGSVGMLELLRRVEAGSDIAVTPDGPRGPRHVCKAGVAALAQKTKIPVYAVSYSTKRRWQLRSWDGMIIPKPFSKGVIICGEPLFVGTEEDLEVAAIRIQEALNEVTARADGHWDVV
jgi:lysophospholipid acyltransferase (LPLAT)-like uncharacterized protein